MVLSMAVQLFQTSTLTVMTYGAAKIGELVTSFPATIDLDVPQVS
jgi:hypothetical protein